MTGTMAAIMVRDSCHDMMNKKMKQTMMKIKDLKNIETFVDNPSYITAVSEPILDTIVFK